MAVESVEEASDSNHLVKERIGNFYDFVVYVLKSRMEDP